MGTILLVDDEPMLLDLFQAVLEDFHRTLVASSVAEALQILEREDVDAVTCDYRLPDGNGKEVIEWIHQHRPKLLKRTALLTGADVLSMHEQGVIVLRKPLSMERLIELVGGWFPEDKARE